jgi:DASS family divalent anion:Na+ symporter
VPSNTARGGGILAPIVDSISKTLGSSPNNNPQKAGQYLNLVGAHANLITAAMFLTGMAANPLVSRAALEIFDIEFGWFKWALGAIVPGLIGLAGLPILIKYLSSPKIESIKPVRTKINYELQKLGHWTKAEIATGIIMVLMLFLWLSKDLHGFGTTTVALSGLILILFLKVVPWESMVKNHKAWDTLIWLGGLLTIATSLKDTGFIFWFSGVLETGLSNFSPILIILSLALIYFYSMYLFSMLTAHIIALSSAMFLIADNLGFEPIIIICLIAYFSNLSGCLTNYSTGPIIIYFGNGYVSPLKWFKIGFIVSIYHIIIWLGIGSIWWKFLGWW